MVIRYVFIILILLVATPQMVVSDSEVSFGGKPKTTVTKEQVALPTTVFEKDDKIIEILGFILEELRILNTYHSIMMREEITIDEVNYKGE